MSVSKIQKHQLLVGALGKSSQTAHKALLSEVLITTKPSGNQKQYCRPKWRDITDANRERYHQNLNAELLCSHSNNGNYESILACLNRAKTNSLGRKRHRPRWAVNSTPKIDQLHIEHGNALKAYIDNPTPTTLNTASILERKLKIARMNFDKRSLMDLLEKLESYHQLTKIRKFYSKIKQKTAPKTENSFVIWNNKSTRESPSFSATKKDYLEWWAQYLEMKFANSSDATFIPPPNSKPKDINGKPITEREVHSAIQCLKNFKAPGIDEITNEDIKLIQMLKPSLILDCLQVIWKEEKCPREFRHALIKLFPKPQKPGKRRDMRFQKNYRPISLLATLRKLLEIILNNRIKEFVRLDESQFGFMNGKSTTDCIFLLCEAILEARYISRGTKGGHHQRLYAAFLDFEGAFDSVIRDLLWKKLYKRHKINGKLLRVIINLFSNIKGQAIVNEMITREFPIDSGVLQGRVLGPTLFLLVIDDLLEELQLSRAGIPMAGTILSVICSADDQTLLALTPDKLQKLLDICYSWAKKNGMNFEPTKCFVVVFNSKTKKAENLPYFHLGEERLDTFYPGSLNELYLGFNITDREHA